MRVDESIRSTGVVTAAAVGRTVAKVFDVLVRNRPHLLSDFKFKGYYMKDLVMNVSALRAGIDEATGVVEQGEDVEKRVSFPLQCLFSGMRILTHSRAPFR